jgi:hypothetical protein
MKPWFIAIGLFSPLILQAQTSWQTLGEGTARWGLFKLYDATLSAPNGIRADKLLADDTPLKLTLCYTRRLTAENFIDGANHVLSKQPMSDVLRDAVEQLHQAYRPVEKGDCYVLQHDPEQGTRLVLNQQTLITITEPEFKALYFGIWLGDKPLSNTLKDNLLENL